MSNTTENGKPILLRRKEVEQRTGLSRSGLYDLIRQGRFPSPVSLGARSVAWVESEISEWITQRIETARRDTADKSFATEKPIRGH